MMSNIETEPQIKNLLSLWKGGADKLIVDSIVEIAPDASLRRYYRVFYRSYPDLEEQSVVAMIFDSVTPAEADGPDVVDSDLAFIRLAKYLNNKHVKVPEVLFSSTSDHIYLLEDLGCKLLADVARDWHELNSGRNGKASSCNREKYEQVVSLYKMAIDQIRVFQLVDIGKDGESVCDFALRKKFSSQLFLKEMFEVLDFAIGDALFGDARNKMEEAMCELANRICEFPYSFTHRDFHSWNLHVDPNGNLRVIDFQDALMGPKCYDLITLLQDRDTDSLLGAEVVAELISYGNEILGIGQSFYEQYAYLSLQRDLKVAGRFSKLAKVRGATAYLKWVPGTQIRIGKSLAFLLDLYPKDEALLTISRILSEYLNDVRVGLQTPLFSRQFCEI